MNAHADISQDVSKLRRPPALLKNVVAMMGLVQTMRDRSPDDDQFGCFYGYSGYGKTEATRFAQIKTGGPRVEIGVSWTKKDLISNILFELGVLKPKGTLSELTRQVIELLSMPEHPPLFIDEADKLVDRGMIENIREIADKSQAPIILIGEEALPDKLAKVERVYGRVISWTPAQPVDLEDCRKLVQRAFGAALIDDEVLEAIRKASEGRARIVVSNLNLCRQFMAAQGLASLTVAGPVPDFINGKHPPRVKRFG
ncbi:ATP-binding protein [Bosea sp. BK604]|uniref:AAA family ATPase n=1 Tax=Bosea sp. BK604 TaxID=2512180 RepID=UPI001045DCC6|nr:ATP-binding protein [Bosea sp. BK604]TCR70492.1 AAA domain-containing protein [Bosea sp. BK604]